MKKLFVTAAVCLLPLLIFVNVFQAYRVEQLNREVAELERQQKELFEKNKRLVMGIEFLKSPMRIDRIADEELELEKVPADRIVRIQVPEAAANE